MKTFEATRFMRTDYAVDSTALAKRLIGATLVRMTSSGARLAGTIVETEAYLGVKDKAAHSFGARRTPRVESMWGEPGLSYVFFTYGMHHCFNVVCGQIGEPVAVLIRALTPTENLDEMRRLRGVRRPDEGSGLRDTDLCSGPAKLCQALAIDRSHNGLDLTTSPSIWIEPGSPVPDDDLVNTPRIGVEYAEEWAARPLRWHLRGSRHVSRR